MLAAYFPQRSTQAYIHTYVCQRGCILNFIMYVHTWVHPFIFFMQDFNGLCLSLCVEYWQPHILPFCISGEGLHRIMNIITELRQILFPSQGDERVHFIQLQPASCRDTYLRIYLNNRAQSLNTFITDRWIILSLFPTINFDLGLKLIYVMETSSTVQTREVKAASSP